MYHKETNTYRATDITGSYDWIFEGIDFTPEHASMTDDDIKGWATQIIEQSKESDIEEVTVMSEEKPDGWLEAKLEEIESDYSDEYDSVEKAIREWITVDDLERKFKEADDVVEEIRKKKGNMKMNSQNLSYDNYNAMYDNESRKDETRVIAEAEALLALQDDDENVRRVAVENSTSERVHLLALLDDDEDVRYAAVRNSTSERVHLLAMQDDDKYVRYAAVRNSTSERVHMLAMLDDDKYVRYAAVRNSTSERVRMLALQDKDERVRTTKSSEHLD